MPDTAALHPRLSRFVDRLDRLVAAPGATEAAVVEGVVAAMRTLVARDDWLAAAFARPHPRFYQQYLLHADPAGRFSVVSFVWGPGQQTPIHDHRTWGVIGMLRGAEIGQRYRLQGDACLPDGAEERLAAGDTAVVSPTVGDIHRVRNALDDRVSVSIHAYGADIGRQPRHVFDPATGAARLFVSGYGDPAEPGAGGQSGSSV
ncbi:cysteine dioxygenase [Xylophilus sp. Kf1]|nr:cysteine dioxygenase [Xylophilus sp. Kf1]